MKRVCFTGHRYINKKDEEWTNDTLNDAVKRAATAGAKWFTSGGAPWWDLWFLEAAMAERWRHAGSPATTFDGMFDVKGLPDGVVVAAAIPFPGFWDHYKDKSADDRIYLTNLEQQLDIVITVDKGGYTNGKMHQRNHFLVDEHDAVITVYDGRKSGGTYNTLKYARKKKKPILWINPVARTERWIRPGVDYG